jgi:hypothetical protein
MTYIQWLLWLHAYDLQLRLMLRTYRNVPDVRELIIEEAMCTDIAIVGLIRALNDMPMMRNERRARWPRPFNRNPIGINYDGLTWNGWAMAGSGRRGLSHQWERSDLIDRLYSILI